VTQQFAFVTQCWVATHHLGNAALDVRRRRATLAFLLSSIPWQPLVKLDVSNAFNTVRRATWAFLLSSTPWQELVKLDFTNALCGSLVQSVGPHGLSCRRSASRHSFHHAGNDILAPTLRSVSVPAMLEPPGLIRGDGKRPNGMTLVPWSGGRSMVWDFTCPIRSPLRTYFLCLKLYFRRGQRHPQRLVNA